jgi:hypothetical protein
MSLSLQIYPYGVRPTVVGGQNGNMSDGQERDKKALTFTRDGRFARELTQL